MHAFYCQSTSAFLLWCFHTRGSWCNCTLQRKVSWLCKFPMGTANSGCQNASLKSEYFSECISKIHEAHAIHSPRAKFTPFQELISLRENGVDSAQRSNRWPKSKKNVPPIATFFSARVSFVLKEKLIESFSLNVFVNFYFVFSRIKERISTLRLQNLLEREGIFTRMCLCHFFFKMCVTFAWDRNKTKWNFQFEDSFGKNAICEEIS